MRHILLVFIVVLAMLSCTAVSNPHENVQAKIDSMVNAKLDSLNNVLRSKNDSIINAKANEKAQEIISKMKH